MIPYFELHVIPIGPLNIQVWGLFVSIGIVAGTWVATLAARRRGLDQNAVLDMVTRAVVAGLVGARLVHAFGYEPAAYLADPLKLLRVWEGGLSSAGAIAGAIAGVWAYARRRKLELRPYIEVLAFAAPLTYGCGRVGCFLIHDHPGTLSSSFLAVQFPAGPRLDHGLLLAVFAFALFGAFVLLCKRAPAFIRRTGYTPLLMLCYGGVRFVLDFFRSRDLAISDARYLGLTPAQYGCLLLFAWGAWLLAARLRTSRHA
jgi:phosphatidylglycerol:prolipoprotein diacylglycerol transferase